MIQPQGNKQNAIPFIVYDQKEGFCLNREAEDYLNSLPEDRKIGVISIVGKYRTGKSFFVNRVLLERGKDEEGFQVGPTINPCTKGLWLWRKELKSSEDDNMDILLVDTEGFGGMDENVNHDSRIFLFSLLLSSYFIYNSQGSIDENALNSLSLIINLAKDIQLKSKNGESQEDDPASHFPSFLWVVRDFALQIVDQMGNKISQKEYLEKALELQKGVSDAIESKNRIRRLMKHFFKERDCSTLVRPVESEKDLQNLNCIANEDLRPEFNEQVDSLRKRIFKKVKPKMLSGRALNGRMLVEMCKAYTEAINKGSLPNIESAWSYVKKCEAQKAFDKSLNRLDEIISQAENDIVEPSEIEALKDRAREEMKQVLKKNALGEAEDYAEYLKLIENSLSKKFSEFKKHNKKLWKKRYASMCEEKVIALEARLQNEEFTNFWDFQAELQNLRKEYESQVPKKDAAAEQYFTEVSERLLKLAGEKISQKQEREHQRQFRKAETMLALTEAELKSKKEDFEVERKRQNERVEKLEKEVISLKCSLQAKIEQIEQLQETKELTDKHIIQLKESLHETIQEREKEVTKKVKELEVILDNSKLESLKKIANYDKQAALLEQENAFLDRENKSLREKITFIENENKKARNDVTTYLAQIDRLRQQVEAESEKGNKERGNARDEFEKKVLEITSETDRKKDIIKQHSEFIIEKTYLQNQVEFYKTQLEENKKIHDALLQAFQSGLNRKDDKSNELGEVFKGQLEKSEIRCKDLQQKNDKLKKYKFAITKCSGLKCAECMKILEFALFEQHAQMCTKNNVNNNSSSSQGNHSSLMNISMTTSQIQNNSSVLTKGTQQLQKTQQQQHQQATFLLTPHLLVISINQTIVKESEDHKPYTEYLIQLQYHGFPWEVARKYKHFCELHQQLTFAFPSFQFPESSQAIINSSTDINHLFTNKRPTVIEDRRKALQQYLRDLAKMDSQILNSPQFKTFLEINEDISMALQHSSQRIKDENDAGIFNTISQQFTDQLHSQRLLFNNNNIESKQIQQQQQQQQQYPFNNQLDMSQRSLNSNDSSQLCHIDKNLLPPSPTSFLKTWTEKNLNKENNTHRSSASTTSNPLPQQTGVGSLTSRLPLKQSSLGEYNPKRSSQSSLYGGDQKELARIQALLGDRY